ncbi:MAG: peptide chain release factor N(5)-glutamine methyltransferase [Dokdonella sp.]
MPSIHTHLLAAAVRLPGDEAAVEARMLLGHVLQRDATWMFTHADDQLGDDESVRFESLIVERLRGVPVAYLIGSRGFWSMDLAVTSDVLIPRPETELLVELALQRIPADAEVDVADLGTGSGAIALALASERPRARVLACDASAAALAVACGNAERIGLANVRFAHGDWYAAVGDARFAVITSNPPYIAVGDAHLQHGDLRYEPALALSSGSDGLDAIRTIITGAPEHFLDGGWLLLEHGWDQGDAVRALLDAAGFTDVATHRDLGDRDRVSLGCFWFTNTVGNAI